MAGTCVVRAGTVVHAATAEALGLPAPEPAAADAAAADRAGPTDEKGAAS